MEYKDLPDAQKHLILECIGRDDVAVLKEGAWDELVRLAQHDADFRSAVLQFELSDLEGLLTVLQSICRSVNAIIACEYALA